MDDSPRRLRSLAALVPLILLLGWRLASCPPSLWWRDGTAILSIYAGLVLFMPEGRPRRNLTIAVMLLMMAAYGSVQIPLALDFLRQAW